MNKFAVAAVGVLLVGCGGSSPATPSTSTSEAQPSPAATQAASPTVAVMVLPENDPDAPVVSAVAAVGSAMLDEQQWTTRFPAPREAIPTLEAEIIEAATEFGDGKHIEERSWLVVDTRDRYDLVAELRKVIGTVHIDTATNTNDAESLCTTSVGQDDTGVEWTVRACDYPDLPDTHAVGIVQTTTGTPEVFSVDDTVNGLLELSGGELTHTSARLRVPQPGQENLVRTARIALPANIDMNQLVDAAKNGPLVEYGVARSDDSAVLTGPRGETWTLTTSVAMFEAQSSW